jgi:putative redox protein
MTAESSVSREWVVVRGPASGFAQQISVGPHQLRGDEPLDAGGTDTGPTPYDLLLAALGTCTSMTISMFARRRKWPLQDVTVRLRHSRIYAEDCADCESKNVRIDRIEREIGLKGDLSDDQRKALLAIAEKCPVHRTLTSEIRIDSRLLE